MSTPQTPASLLSVHPMSDAGQIEAAEAQADQLEHDWWQVQADLTLAEALAADRPELAEPAAREAWQIDGDNTAVWALRKLAAQRDEIDRIDRIADAEIDRVKRWAEDAKRQPERAAAFFEAKLIDYRRDLETYDPALPKTYRLPAGDICVRAGRASVKVIDESAFVDWACDNRPSALTYKPKVSALKDCDRADDGHLVDTATGELIPGVVEITADPTYSVKPSVSEDLF